MYHCHIHFYLLGQKCRIFEVIKEMPPMEQFTHEYLESTGLETPLASGADVILANLQEADAGEAVRGILSCKAEKSQLILLAEKEQTAELRESLDGIRDIWTLPMSDEEIAFRFLRWQQNYRLEKEYWQTNHFLEATIDNVPNLIWYKDKSGIHEKVNKSFCETVNKTREQVQGRRHAYIWDVEEDDPACIESENEVMRSGKTRVSEEIIKTGEGMRTLTTYKSPLYDLDGSVMGTVGIGIDVTQERAYEQEIIQKNHNLETIFTTIDCGVMRHTLDGTRILSANRAALKILGYDTLEELIAEGFDMVASSVLEEDREKLCRCISELKKEGDCVSVEYRVRHKSGDILHIMGNVKLLRENGELIYQRFLLDCTEQKRLEKEKDRRQRELIQALSVEYSLVCFFELNTGVGRLLRNNDENGRNFGDIFNGKISLEESLERYINTFVYEEDRKMLRQFTSLDRLREKSQSENLYSGNYRVCRGEEIEYFQMKVVRAGAPDGSRGIVLGLRSVDAEIRSEMEQKNLLEDALMQANRASRAKSVFLSNMSHDIRTPMNAIVGFTALALTHIDHREQVEEYLGKIMTSGNHLLSLINDVLDMSRIESGKIHLEEKPCRLPDILHGLRNIIQADIRAKQLELYIDAVDVVNEDIYCDKLRLNQVLLNLLSNSIKYTGPPGLASIPTKQPTPAPAGYASYELIIKDNGIGMSKEFAARIFEPFEREKNSTVSGIQGTGLGMAITKNIVDLMNGVIEVESEQGKGTEFTVCFTFRLNAEGKEPRDIPEFKNCRALVVDDDFNTCDSVSYMLQEIGMRAEWTLSGKEAVLRTRQAHDRGDEYLVYIIDWLLPDMNGVEVTRRIRKEMGDDVPVIVLTAYDWSDIEQEAKEAGVTAFCSKPLFFSELRNCLNSVVGRPQAGEKDEESKNVKRRSGRILLAEDVELNQEIAVTILEDAGFEAEVAENGKIALDMLEKSSPGYYQLVLMDVQMPVMDGYTATKHIRQLENRELASIPIIAMTANAFEEDRQEALRCGMNGHIAKPIDMNNLFTILDKALS